MDMTSFAELQLRPDDLRRWIHVAYELTCLGRTYVPTGVVHAAVSAVFCAIPLPSMGTREEYKAQKLSGWREFCPNLELVDVDGEHYTMLSEANVRSFADKLSSSLDRAESASQSIISRKLDFDEVPIIDFSLAQSDPPRYYQQLKFALEDVGFGVFVNVPGFEGSFQRDLFSLADRLFKKPQSWKDALGTDSSYALRGYFRADTIPGPHKVCWSLQCYVLDVH